MTCGKCGGLVVRQPDPDVGPRGTELRCLNCGWRPPVLNPVPLEHRPGPKPGSGPLRTWGVPAKLLVVMKAQPESLATLAKRVGCHPNRAANALCVLRDRGYVARVDGQGWYLKRRKDALVPA